MTLPARNKKGRRTGFTTGACAAASAKAAVRYLVTGIQLSEIETTLPNRKTVTFPLKRCEKRDGVVITSIIKDAGDDPDCTHGAEITTTVRLTEEEGITLINGDGVGKVTKSGLGLDIGAPSITPVPRKNISEMVLEELSVKQYKGVQIIISVPDGVKRAKKTINERLGIMNGISILGTTGIVKPYSTAAYKASVVQEINVAYAQGIRKLVFTTGSRTEKFAMDLFPFFKEESFIQAGDFIGTALKSAARTSIKLVHIVGMIGKLSKMADGKMQTHVAGSKVNMDLLAKLAEEAGVDAVTCEQIKGANTARHAIELIKEIHIKEFGISLCRLVARVTGNYIQDQCRVSVYLFDFDGHLLAQFSEKECS
ncbi:MAG: cobalt-precorrin-5B (C(1))-methyltransferase [Candidatus Scalindua sp. AMX11]|nr:MAG: cobalt-precorrin-5B (C(1))-methyltransferase [Candidatus Scalindua sp.]NOG84476.1 cobalt-precorrin-5B (C(1))-methyltransferase [Planctomycetota bacterium]RZV80515.1 MAG: cobalt-precorrin-5B (C(1))-methyltransferase [Candidatus Scalindua sp. SCAELEC01]TDE65268.1 MAG: cobalt-precorrin-5B (C(1))-methyltransferase [Candidatus Scalindua sp. AMX11]GJQ58477.1 MAG: cobalt-precorrin-5B C(1)-methyltransferase [Candidatus Scalindua sp.]